MTTIIQIGNSTTQIVVKSAIYECDWRINRGSDYNIAIGFNLNGINICFFVIGKKMDILDHLNMLYDILCKESLDDLYKSEIRTPPIIPYQLHKKTDSYLLHIIFWTACNWDRVKSATYR